MDRKRSSNVEEMDCAIRVKGKTDVPEVRLDMYFDTKGKDFRLLMNLWSETAGVAQAFRILAVFDKHFQRQWRARDIKIIVENESPRSQKANKDTDEEEEDDDHHAPGVINGFASAPAALDKQDGQASEDGGKDHVHKSVYVLWNDAPIADYIARTSKRSMLEYTVDITPCTEAPVKSFLYHAVPDFTASSYDLKIRDSTRELLLHNWKRMRALYSYKYSTRFDGLVQGTEYTVSLSTELDGKTITQVNLVAIKGAKTSKENNSQDKEKKDKKKDGLG